MQSKFSLGQVCVSAGVDSAITQNPAFMQFINNSLARHAKGDWGDLCSEDREGNEFSLKNGYRLLSAYKNDDQKIWIITEADRSATTVLFPDEY